MGNMIRRLTTTTLVFLLAALFVLASTGCPAKQPDQGPMRTPPADTGDTPPADTPPAVTEDTPPAVTGETPPAEVELGPLKTVVVDFYMAMSALDFDTARTYCTAEYWTEFIEPLIQLVAEASEEEIAVLLSEFQITEEMRAALVAAEETIEGESGSLTIVEAEDTVNTLLFTMVDGTWLMSGVG
jgi:hypothetical protein